MTDQPIDRIEDIPAELRPLFIQAVKAARHVQDLEIKRLHTKLLSDRAELGRLRDAAGDVLALTMTMSLNDRRPDEMVTVAEIRDALRPLTEGPSPSVTKLRANDFVLYPPSGWLNRVDEVLQHHGATDHDRSYLGEALGRLIRSWRRIAQRDSDTAPGPEYWGPTADQVARRTGTAGNGAGR